MVLNLMKIRFRIFTTVLLAFTFLCCALLQPSTAQAQREAPRELPLVMAHAVSAGIEEARERAEPGNATGPIYLDSARFNSMFRKRYGEGYSFDHSAFRAALPPKLRGQMQAGKQIEEVRQKHPASRSGEEKHEIARNGVSVGVSYVKKARGKYFVVVIASYNESRHMKGQKGVGSLRMEYFVEKEGGQWKTTLRKASWLIF